jgi:uncharacterized membrane protein YfcA
MSVALLAAVAVAVGFFVGAVGVGGVLLIPALVLLGGLGIHVASATALFTFLFTGLLGTWLFHRQGSIERRLVIPVCGGSALFSYLGAMAASMINARPLEYIIAAIIIVAGVYVLRPSRRGAGAQRDGRGPAQQALLLAVGAVAGFGSGLSGAGGAAFSVPMMMALGFNPLASIGVSQVLQIVVATSGTLGNLQYGAVDFATAAWVSVLELAGVFLGVRAAHAAPIALLRGLAAVLCIAVGGFMLLRA